ncbi:MAG: septum formation protein Maf [Alphaproteobacteria bacterium]|nr:septum formation protein Maf [Alphaproteobacteria bacterium]
MSRLPGAARTPLILASGSAIRATVLRNAGLSFEVMPPGVDEDEVKRALQAERATAEVCATALAELKAQRVSSKRPDALVIGADQMLECDGAWFDKPPDRAGAVAHLRALRGKTHALVGAVVLAQGGRVIWRHVERARLSMRPFDDAFIERYLEATGDAVLQSVGAYQLEGLGVHLFSHIDGDHYMILGLPLLPLLDILRQHKVVP